MDALSYSNYLLHKVTTARSELSSNMFVLLVCLFVLFVGGGGFFLFLANVCINIFKVSWMEFRYQCKPQQEGKICYFRAKLLIWEKSAEQLSMTDHFIW